MNGDRFQPVEIEAHTDLVDVADVVNAFEALLPVAEGDRVAAALLAVGAVLAEAIRERS